MAALLRTNKPTAWDLRDFKDINVETERPKIKENKNERKEEKDADTRE
jgi:hypothetical protein